jgi:hypothetical protein
MVKNNKIRKIINKLDNQINKKKNKMQEIEICKLKRMFKLRKSFINRMQKERPGSYPVPVPLTNLSDKKSQQVCRDLALRGVEEMFEALQHLKNWKPHKLTEEKEFNKEEFLEEIVDAFNYFMALLIVVDVDHDKLFEAYIKKDKKIRKRLDEGY